MRKNTEPRYYLNAGESATTTFINNTSSYGCESSGGDHSSACASQCLGLVGGSYKIVCNIV